MKPEQVARILNEHGRQALARVLYAELPREERPADLFFAMYGDAFPADERISPGDAFEQYDPTGFEALYREGDRHAWRVSAVRMALGSVDWSPERLSQPWRVFIVRLFAADPKTQKEALLQVLDASPDNEPFLEDLFDVCEVLKAAEPFDQVHRKDGCWPDPARESTDPLSPIEIDLEIDLNVQAKHED
jgi:hypothetical protein